MESNSSLVLGALIPQLELTFVMPSHFPGKESSGGDAESFLPDSSSIPDDMLIGKLCNKILLFLLRISIFIYIHRLKILRTMINVLNFLDKGASMIRFRYNLNLNRYIPDSSLRPTVSN